eukprot:CAMPEP_0194713292 /NCGR_PEP_ID=MMETSP0296-20130528/5195_1 /TAXON_ID=39354 /ORGANISM="Heterosigma akashiwo, Strain CCMP2393" /LENGTH=89 /DNA_ID=CAMNT_0039611999 /DNA_START=502 /DNA_END=767 /DNA_ORIENTATION=-
MWFAGLRGAIAYALAANMPGPHAELYTTTTLSVVIFTTVVCGGLTEPALDRLGMKTSPAQRRDTALSEEVYEGLLPESTGGGRPALGQG